MESRKMVRASLTDGTKEFICRVAMEKQREQTYGHGERGGEGEM